MIPQELRKRYGLRRGALVRFVDYGGVLAIFPVPEDPNERRKEREKEER